MLFPTAKILSRILSIDKLVDNQRHSNVCLITKILNRGKKVFYAIKHKNVDQSQQERSFPIVLTISFFEYKIVEAGSQLTANDSIHY